MLSCCKMAVTGETFFPQCFSLFCELTDLFILCARESNGEQNIVIGMALGYNEKYGNWDAIFCYWQASPQEI